MRNMDKKPKYSLFPTHPPSTPPSEPLPPLPEGQQPSPLVHTTFPRPPSRASPIKSHATFPSLPLQGLPHATFTSPNHQPPLVSSPEKGPPPHHFDPAFPPPLPHLPPPSHPHIGTPPPIPQAPQSRHHQEPSATPAELEANNPWPPFNNSWPAHEDSASTLKGTPTPAESITPPPKSMHAPTLSTSTTSSTSSLHKPAPTTNIVTPPSQPQTNTSSTRPRTVYFHSGLGGAGNYHKAIREDNVLKPMIGNRSTHPKFLSSLFGTLGGKKARRQQQQQQQQQQQYNGTSSDGTGSGSSSSQALPLGAAEVMRRKMLGLDGKARSKG